MPVYDYICDRCGIQRDIWAKIKDVAAVCPSCNGAMRRLFSPSRQVIPDLTPYLDENISATPTYVKSKRHRRDLMKRNGLVEIG